MTQSWLRAECAKIVALAAGDDVEIRRAIRRLQR